MSFFDFCRETNLWGKPKNLPRNLIRVNTKSLNVESIDGFEGIFNENFIDKGKKTERSFKSPGCKNKIRGVIKYYVTDIRHSYC